MSKTENDKWQLGRDTPIAVVDRLAKELETEFQNLGWYKWYCRAIYDLGVDKIMEIKGRVSDARDPGKLFSKYVNEARNLLKNQWLIKRAKEGLND